MIGKNRKLTILGIIIMALVAIGFCSYRSVSAQSYIPDPPDTPTNFRLTSIDDNATFTLKWDTSDNADFYIVNFVWPEFPLNQILQVAHPEGMDVRYKTEENQMTFYHMDYNTTYLFRVRAHKEFVSPYSFVFTATLYESVSSEWTEFITIETPEPPFGKCSFMDTYMMWVMDNPTISGAERATARSDYRDYCNEKGVRVVGDRTYYE